MAKQDGGCPHQLQVILSACLQKGHISRGPQARIQIPMGLGSELKSALALHAALHTCEDVLNPLLNSCFGL